MKTSQFVAVLVAIASMAAVVCAQDAAGAAATTAESAAAAETASSATAGMTDLQKQSYAVGVNIGAEWVNKLRGSYVEFDTAAVAKGLSDALDGKVALTVPELQALLAEVQKAAQARYQKLSEDNKVAGEAFLAENKLKAEIKTLPSGLQYKVVMEGTGPKPTAEDTVTVHYTGKLIDGTVFDSSVERGEPATFPLAGVIPGWTQAIQLMPVGSKWELYIPSSLGYGPRGRPPRIGPNSVLIFDVELLAIEGKASSDQPAEPAPKNEQPATTAEKPGQ